MKQVRTLIKALLLVFTAVLPLKLTQGIGTPSFPAVYSGDFFSILYNAWSPYLVACLAACLLLLSLLLPPDPQAEPVRKKRLTVYFLLWLFTALIAFAGIRNASCMEYVRQTLVWLAGLVCFAGAVRNVLIHDRTFGNKLLATVLIGTLLAASEGWQQMNSGSAELEAYLKKNGITPTDALLRELRSTRIRGTFTVCNVYAGFLASVLAWLGFFAFSRFKEKNNRSPWFLRGEVIAVFAVFLAVPLWMTGSRGAVLALFAGLFAVSSVFAWRSRKGKIALCVSGVLAIAAVCLFVILRRGAGSILFRMDYFQASFKMMLAHPFAGTGWGDFFHEYPRLKTLINDETPHSPHNFLLFFGSQCGIPGFLAALALTCYPLFVGFRTLYLKICAKEQGILYDAAILAGCVAFSVDAMFEMSMESCGFAFASILFSMLVLNETPVQENVPSCKPFVARTALILMALIGLFTIVFSVSEMRREAAFSQLFYSVQTHFSANPSHRASPEEIARLGADAVKAAPENPFVCVCAGMYAERRKDWAYADAMYSKAIELAPEDYSLYQLRFLVRKDGGLPPDVVRGDLEKIRSLAPNHPRWHQEK